MTREQLLSRFRRVSASISVIFLVSGLSVCLFRVPTIHAYFYGDDYLVYEASRLPYGYASQPLLGLLQAGGGKYRPLFTPLVAVALKFFGNSYLGFQSVSWVLLVLVATVAASIVLEITTSLLATYMTIFAVTTSRFTWYGQTSVHGLMEFLALLLLLIAIRFHLRYLATRSTTNLVATVLAVAASSFVHERYLIAVVIFWILTFVAHRSWGKRMAGLSLLFPSVVLAHIVLKNVVIGVSYIKGGGETSLSGSLGPWIIIHFFLSVVGTLGFSSGVNDYFLRNGYQLIDPFQRTIGVISARTAFAGLALLLLFYVAALLRRSLSKPRVGPPLLSLWLLCLTLLIPPSTVISRIETRWLLGSFICAFIATATMISALPRGSNKKTVVGLAIALLLISTYHYQRSLDTFSYDRRIAQSVLNEASLKSTEGRKWNLAIRSREVIPWMFGYGRAFSQLDFPPRSVTFGPTCTASPCLLVTTREGRIFSKWIVSKSHGDSQRDGKNDESESQSKKPNQTVILTN